MAVPPDDLIIVGKLGAAYGVRGWLKLHSSTDPIDNILSYRPWWLSRPKGWEEINISQGKAHGQSLIIHIQGCDDRNDVPLYTGANIAISRQLLPPLPAQQYYWTDLQGLTVFTINDELLGTVDHLLETGGNDVLVIKGERDRMIPFLQPQVIKQVDLDKGCIHVDWDPEF